MTNPIMKTAPNGAARLLIFTLLIGAVGSISTLSSAAVRDVSRAELMMTITVTNNSSREVDHLYLSPVDRNRWGPDLLNGTIIRTGESFAISDVTCEGNEIKIIAEDKTGCFTYGTLGCGQNATDWIITNDMPADCGN